MGRVGDNPWKHSCPDRAPYWPCSVRSRPASDHRIYTCGYQEKLEPNGATHIWTDSHPGCRTPNVPCESKTAFQISVYDCGLVYNNKDETMSYVESSMYESETPLEEAERLLAQAKASAAVMQRKIEKLKREARFGEEPQNGSIIRFEKRYNPSDYVKYTFAALRVNGLWYLTGSGHTQHTPMKWDDLKTFIGNGKMWTPRNYVQAPDA